MRAYFNTRDEFYKSPFGAVKTGTTVKLRLRVYEPVKGLKCNVVLWQDNEKLATVAMDIESQDDGYVYVCDIKMPQTPSIIWYHFVLENLEEKYYYCSKEKNIGGEGVLIEDNPISFQQTVYKNDKVVSKFKQGIIYQIFPDRFYRGSDYEKRKEDTYKRIQGKDHGKVFVDDWDKVPRYKKDANGKVHEYEFFGGTLKGIEEKLPYIKSLGATYIYLNPIFEARSNHRYDTGDYKKIDSLLGDEESLVSLINSAKKLGIGIILDGVFSHQGADSKYFNKYNNYDEVGAYNSKDSKYYAWYDFIEYPDVYKSWWGVEELPNVNELNEDYVDYICRDEDSVIKHYMKLGIAGFRLDVADELPDEFIGDIREAIDSVDTKAIIIGEVWDDATNKVSYDMNRKYMINSTLKSVTNYPFMTIIKKFMKGIVSPYELYEFFWTQLENYPMEYFYSLVNLLDSHDRVRILTELSDSPDKDKVSDEYKYTHYINTDKYYLAVSRLKTLLVLLYTIPGVPLIYYGDEAGVSGYDDPYNRKTYPWGNEDTGLINHYKMLGELRNKNKVINSGDFKPIFVGVHTFGYERTYKDEKVIVLINRGIFYNEGEKISIKVGNVEAFDLIENKDIEVKDGNLEIALNPLGYKVIKTISNCTLQIANCKLHIAHCTL